MTRSFSPRALAAALLLIVVAGAVLLAMGRPPICPCGTVRLWHGTVQSAENSQQIADWYSLSHVVHGVLFYAATWALWRMWPAAGLRLSRWSLVIAVGIEAAWEVLENTPAVIERYRAVTVSWGYSGDSVLNSAADIGWMTLGFWLASRLPARLGFALAVALELVSLAVIRDNLTLNLLMLAWPLDAIRQWQAG